MNSLHPLRYYIFSLGLFRENNPTFENLICFSRRSEEVPGIKEFLCGKIGFEKIQSFSNMLRRAAVSNSKVLFRASFANKHTLPDLEYDYGELAPFISARIMQLHHDKHHRAYIKNFNDALDQLEDVKPKSEEEKKRIDQSIRFNGGGHFNHSLFWQLLAPNGKGGGEVPPESSPLIQAIISEWGSVKKFQESFNAKATGVQGTKRNC